MPTETKTPSPASLSDAKQSTISIAIAVALVVPICGKVERAAAPHLGSWGALGVCLLTAAVIGGLVGTAVTLWFKRFPRR